MKRNIVITLLILFVITSCSNNREKDLKAISDLEKILKEDSSGYLDKAKAAELVDAYIKFAKDCPDDTASAAYLFKAASLSMNIGKSKLSVDLFDQIMTDYPTCSRIPDCMFFKAFVYDNNLRDYQKAREGYEAYLKKYPAHSWAKDIPGLLKMLGKTSEQIGAELKEKQKNDSIANVK
jgi:tetratricopeptide (TPR) repeat protein